MASLLTKYKLRRQDISLLARCGVIAQDHPNVDAYLESERNDPNPLPEVPMPGPREER